MVISWLGAEAEAGLAGGNGVASVGQSAEAVVAAGVGRGGGIRSAAQRQVGAGAVRAQGTSQPESIPSNSGKW